MKPNWHLQNNSALPSVGPQAVSRSLMQQYMSVPKRRRPLKLQPLNTAGQLKDELISRLYSQGVPRAPLPSVGRNGGALAEQKNFSAKLRSRRAESLSPMRKRMHELNVSVAESALRDQSQDPVNDSSDVPSKLLSDLNVSEVHASVVVEEELMKAQYQRLRSQHETMFSVGKNSITGLSIMSSLKPMPGASFDRGSIYSLKSRYLRGVNRRGRDASIAEVSRMSVAKDDRSAVEPEMSPQEHLEKIWSKKLIEKLRNRGDESSSLLRQSVQSPNESLEKAVSVSMSLARQQSTEKNKAEEDNSREDKPEEKKSSEEWQDLDKYLESLLEDSEQVTTKFMYFNMRCGLDNPYDLTISSYNDRQTEHFYTISGKGVTQYRSDKAMEFIPLGEWLIERDLYAHVKEIPFFKHFKRWKLLKVWRKGIVFMRRKQIIDELGERLFYVDDIYRDQILRHRAYMCEMSKLRLIDVQKQSGDVTLEEFARKQQKKQKFVAEKIKEFSAKCRDNFRTVISKSLKKLREHIELEKSLDEDKGAQAAGPKKPDGGNAVFEAIGFPGNLIYGHRAALRRECMRFLRLAYLVDFLSVKALGDIYLDTVREVLCLLERLDVNAKAEINVAHDILRKTATMEPILQISVLFDPSKEIPAGEVVNKEVKEFSEKSSRPEEFDLACHVELMPEKDEDNPTAPRTMKKYITQEVPKIVGLWLNLKPSKEAFVEVLCGCFRDGLKVVESFERWSKHDELTPYANALEQWDELVGGNWDEPENNSVDPKVYICDQEIFQSKESKIRTVISSAYEKGFLFLNEFKEYLHDYWANDRADFNLLLNDRVQRPVETLTSALKLFGIQKQKFLDQIPETCNLGILKIDCSAGRKALLPSPVVATRKIEELATVAMRSRLEEVRAWITQSRNELQIKVLSVEDYVRQKNSWNRIADAYQGMKDRVDVYGNVYNIMTDFSMQVKKDDRNFHTETLQEMMQLNQIIANVSDQQELNLDTFKKKLQEQMIPQLMQDLDQLKKDIEDEKLLTKEEGVEENLQKIEKLEARFKAGENAANKYRGYQQTLNMEPVEFAIVDEVREGLSLRADLWKSLREWNILTERWTSQQFATINSKEIGNKAEYYAKIAYRVDRELPENPVSNELKVVVDTFKKAVPVVLSLRNENLQKHHWKAIKDLLKSDFEIGSSFFTLKSLLDMGAVEHQEDIQQISVQASQEALLKGQLAQLDELWKQVTFTVKPYKGKEAYVLDDVETLLNVLDESLANTNTILGSRYIKPLLSQAENWRTTLLNLQVIMDEWVTCQHQWIYLENIFSGQDIKKQLANEAAKFETVDKFFRNLMQRAYKNSQPLKLLKLFKGDLLENLRRHNKSLDEIQKMLEDYLETKRKAFPRFYFISNDELLEILANQQKLEVVQQSLRKCFDNLVKLDIHENLDIAALYSSEGERVPFYRPAKVKDNVENWLDNVQNCMRDTLFRAMKVGLVDYDSTDRKDWVLKHPGQVVATVAQIMWCTLTEASIGEMANNPNAMMEWYEENVEQIQQLTELVRGKLDSVSRRIIVALVTTDVHARDIIESLVLASVAHLNDFNWQKQLRYYWEDDDSVQQSQGVSCYVRQVSARLEYGYEYIGPSSRLVITPLTDRCWMTITGALHIHLGAAPAGPAGTGKTESTKDLAKGLGMFCIVFNCSEQINYRMMGRLFSGVVQQGAWTCLDEFNRINIEVLSVVARQVMEIRMALTRGDKQFTFEEKEIAIQGNCGIFITMNPGYAGRTELPDNLKVNFRPVSMMIPDYELIAEIMLFAEGFGRAKALSKKMVKLYKLASEQLSQQDHYDFGMRAVKSVLVMAGALKRAEPSLPEEAVLLRAMRDSNVPKFVKDDLPLFYALIRDLFPTLEVEQVNYGFLQKQIEASITKMGLQCVPSFILKVIQLFEIFNIRFGVMIVGPTGGGKTACFEVLKDAMTELSKLGTDERFQPVTVEILNPKAIALGELYGEINSSTQEWRDGLASKLIRKAADETGKTRNWIVFDGPVDSLWIENMNTVLDDTMTLCLSNGQRIKLRFEMKMLFEVQDLAVASPATVSRCGMVYVAGETVGWKPYVQSWIKRTFPDETIVPNELQDQLMYLFELSVDRGASKIRSGLNEPIRTADIQLVASMCNLLEVFLNEKYFTGEKTYKKKLLQYIFAFSYTWGLSGSVDESSKEKMDFLIRNIFESADFPGAQTVYDYYMDPKKDMSFRPWADLVPAFEYNAAQPFFQIIVPTVETVRQGYCLEQLLSHQKSVFFTGITGIGKSVIVQHTLAGLQATQGIVPVQITFSAQTSSLRTQFSIEEKLQKKRRDLYGAQVGQKIAIFVDDVNMPAVEQYGAQPPVELLRLLLDKHGVYDREKLFWKWIEDTTLICAAGPPGGGRRELSQRFTRRFNMVCISAPNKGVMQQIYQSILKEYLKAGNYTESIQGLAQDLVIGTIEVYECICDYLKPTPAKFHYTFNLRDVSKVFQGIMMTRSQSVGNAESLAKLWVHEICRVFYDRLTNAEDKAWLGKLAVQYSGKYIKTNWEYEDVFEKNKIYWGDALKLDAPIRLYEEIKDTAKLRKVLENQLEDYNMKATRKMQLVFFEDAMEHILRISRALRQPKGYIMLIGVGGSGKSVLTRLAAFMQRYETKELEVKRDAGNDAFKDYLKDLLQNAGVTGNQLCFLLTDTQVSNEGLLEDVNSLLNNGEIPNLYATEELDKIINELRPAVAELKRDESRNSIYSFFVERIRNNLHICLCMSPVGETLRLRCRKFPSLINCCTLNWFSRWPNSALLSVSTKFLNDIDGTTPAVKKALAEMCMQIHTTVEEKAAEFFSELRRRVYITPKSYLDLIRVYIEGLKNKRREMDEGRNRLIGGIEKLKETGKQIAEMKKKLENLQPKLKEKSESLEISQKKVAEEQRFASEKERLVTIQSQEVNEKAKKAKAIADEAEADLNVLKPELDAAMTEVRQLDKKSIIEIKTFNNPNPLVVMVMEAVMMLLDEKTDWSSIRFTLSDSGEFVSRLINFGDKVSKVPESVIKKLRANYLSNPEFEPDKVASKSLAAKSIVKWVKAMNNFYDVQKKVEPKRRRYEEEKANLDLANSALAAKMTELNEIKAKVAKLKADCDVMQAERNRLAEEMSVTRRRLARAEELMGLLSDEDARWNSAVDRIKEDGNKLVGNVFLSAACISYLGPFTGPYRESMISQWAQDIVDRSVPASPSFRLITTMGDPILIREWQNNGLPTDSVSVENAIIATEAMRYPLMVDPQMQANRWVKQILKKQGVIILRLSSGELMRTLSNAIRIGKSVLIEDVEETIDASLDALLEKQVFQNESGIRFIRLDNKDVEYDPNFKLYMTSKLPNPHYMPEVCIKVTVINFTVTFEGLEDQLLGDVVKQEQPEVEEKRDEIIKQLAADKKGLKEAEDNILKLLANSTLEQILDEDAVVETLKNAKFTSAEITKRMEESAKIEVQIDKARNSYRSVASRGSSLYFVIADLMNIDSMYQYSLDYIKQLFNLAIEKSPKGRDQQERMEILINNITKLLFANVSRGLFEAHKTIFSFLICTSIRRKEAAITEQEWNYLIRGVGVFKGEKQANPLPKFVSEASWTLALTMDRDVPKKFGGLVKDIAANKAAWEKYAQQPEVHLEKLPGKWEAALTAFEKLLVLKVFRPEMMLMASIEYVKNELGKFYIENGAGSIEDVYQDSKKSTPIIFVLSQGADPTLMLLKFADDHKYRDKMSMLSLGQGQGPAAKRMIQAAQTKGDWVLLQNCHLAKSWMRELESLVEGFKDTKTLHEDFRLFLTSMPADYFPASVLQNGVKLTTEPPRGIKANLKRSYQELSQARFTSCGKKVEAWRKLLFGLCFFHSVVQERRKFGPLGFNIRYEFNDSDLETSTTMLKMFLEEQESIPWEALNFVTGHINYGGRVTDDWDRRCLLCILKIFYTPEILKEDYKFSDSGTYFAPSFETLEEYRQFIDKLPLNDAPEIFGMHENANITYHGNEAATLLRTILKVQPRSAATVHGGDRTSGKSPDDTVLEYIAELQPKTPIVLDQGAGRKDLFLPVPGTGLMPSLSTVLLQEMERFDRLITVISTSLEQLQKAIKGEIVMSQDLDSMYLSFLNTQVPDLWARVAYPSLKPLFSWFADLVKRVEFMRSWLTQGQPATFWLPGFFFPQGFMTGTLQTFARKYKTAIDKLNFGYQVMKESTDDLKVPPKDGVYVYGLFMEGARWDTTARLMGEQLPGVMYGPVPPIHFVPAQEYQSPAGTYSCPVYKTSVRAGVLSTTGQSTNYVVCIDLPTVKSSDYWTLKGTAILCQLND